MVAGDGKYKNSSRLRCTFPSNYKNVEAGTTFKYTTISAIIIIHCCRVFLFNIVLVIQPFQIKWVGNIFKNLILYIIISSKCF